MTGLYMKYNIGLKWVKILNPADKCSKTTIKFRQKQVWKTALFHRWVSSKYRTNVKTTDSLFLEQFLTVTDRVKKHLLRTFLMILILAEKPVFYMNGPKPAFWILWTRG